jgi:hypothetical protein
MFERMFFVQFLLGFSSFFAYRIGYPMIILPGFGNDMIDYISPFNKGTEFGFLNSLNRRGIDADVVPIKRFQWLNYIRGTATVDFWRGCCKAGELYRFYYESVDLKVREMYMKYKKPVILVGHSAGGWLGRGLLGDGVWGDGLFYKKESNDILSKDLILGLVTLGTPHYPPSGDVFDVTRGALKSIDERIPGSYLLPDIFYVTIGGTAVIANKSAPRESIQNYAYGSYSLVNGLPSDGEVGDGVVPLSSMHLKDAVQLTLPNVYHSINAPNNLWYGGDDVIDKWLGTVEREVKRTQKIRLKWKKSSSNFNFW